MIKSLVVILAIVTGGFLQAQTPAPPLPTKAQEKEELPTKKEYDRALKHYTEWKNKFNDLDYWKSVTLTRVSDKKEYKVKDLEEFDRQAFFLSNLRRCTFEMTRLHGFWHKELVQYMIMPPLQDGVPTVDELTAYIEKLTTLRKEAAATLEAYAEKFVKDNPSKFTKEEREQLLKSIKDYHDEQKLIERKK